MLDSACGCVVECDDVDFLEREIIRICTDNIFSREDCLKKSESFDKDTKFREYLELYKSF